MSIELVLWIVEKAVLFVKKWFWYDDFMQNNLVTFDKEALKITVRPERKKELVITRHDVFVSFYSGGPGGQNVNRSMNGVRLIYRIPDEYRRQAARTQELIARSMNQRSQEQNLRAAFVQLADKLRKYFYVKPPRKKTKTPQWAKKKRLQDKKIHSRKKQARRQVDF